MTLKVLWTVACAQEARSWFGRFEALLLLALSPVVNDEGEYVRHPARWDELPGRAHRLLETLIKARLLTAGGGMARPGWSRWRMRRCCAR